MKFQLQQFQEELEFLKKQHKNSGNIVLKLMQLFWLQDKTLKYSRKEVRI